MRNELGVACGGVALTCTYADGLCAAHVQLGDATTTRPKYGLVDFDSLTSTWCGQASDTSDVSRVSHGYRSSSTLNSNISHPSPSLPFP